MGKSKRTTIVIGDKGDIIRMRRKMRRDRRIIQYICNDVSSCSFLVTHSSSRISQLNWIGTDVEKTGRKISLTTISAFSYFRLRATPFHCIFHSTILNTLSTRDNHPPTPNFSSRCFNFRCNLICHTE